LNPQIDDFHVRSPSGQPRGVVLVAHGINFRPSRMNEVEDIFLEQGYTVLRVILTGHEEDTGNPDWPEVDAHRWLEEIRLFREKGAELAAGKPMYFCGFSLGGLIGPAEYVCARQDQEVRPGARYRKMILIAPAVCLRPWAHILRLFFCRPQLRLMSLAGKYYDVRPYIPVFAYQALFDLRSLLAARKEQSPALASTPILVIYDKLDILVSGRAFLRYLAKKQGISAQSARIYAKNLWHHLVTDRRALGESGWNRLIADIKSFMEE
jgi:pimeloyl-ACP methyl ester carboxylesterase